MEVIEHTWYESSLVVMAVVLVIVVIDVRVIRRRASFLPNLEVVGIGTPSLTSSNSYAPLSVSNSLAFLLFFLSNLASSCSTFGLVRLSNLFGVFFKAGHLFDEFRLASLSLLSFDLVDFGLHYGGQLWWHQLGHR